MSYCNLLLYQWRWAISRRRERRKAIKRFFCVLCETELVVHFRICCRFDGVQIGELWFPFCLQKLLNSLNCVKMTIIFDSLFAFVECLMFHFIPDILLLAAHAIDWIKSIFLLIFFFYIIKTTNEQAQKYKKNWSLWFAKSSSSSSARVVLYFQDFQ